MKVRSLRGPSHFTWLWLGQVVSLTGSGVTSFSLGVWVFRETGSVTWFSLISLFTVLPGILMTPFAGALADAFDRRTLILLSDTGCALTTLVVGYLFQQGSLELGHIYVITAISSVLNAIQWPAYLAVVTSIMPKDRLTRYNAMMQFGRAAAQMGAPLLAGALVTSLGLKVVFFLDFGTFLFAVFTMAMVRVPAIAEKQLEKTGKMGARYITYGLHFIRRRSGLAALLMLNMLSNFLMAVVEVLGRPMILSNNSEAALGSLLATGGLGMVIGSSVMSVWGGPKHKIKGVVSVQVVLGVCLVLMGVSHSVVFLGPLIFLFYFCLPISTGSNLAVWQRKVPDDARGRVFATQRAVNWSMRLAAYAGAGPLVELILLPLLERGGALSSVSSYFLPTGGIGLMFVAMGLLTIAITLFSWGNPRLRGLEGELPDACAVA